MANYTLNYTGEKVDELLNKIDTAFGETTVTKDAITWDGNTDGLDNVMGMFYRVSGATPTLEDMQNGGTIKTFTPDGEMTVEFTGEQAMDGETAGMGTNLIMLNGGDIPIFIATQDGATIINGETETTISIEKAGIYLPSVDGVYISYFAINNYQVEYVEITPIPPKYLPFRGVEFVNIIRMEDDYISLKTYAEVENMLSNGAFVVARMLSEGLTVYAPVVGIVNSTITFANHMGEISYKVEMASDNSVTVTPI